MVKPADGYHPSDERQSGRGDAPMLEGGPTDTDTQKQRVLEVIAELDRAVGELRKSSIRG